MYNALDSSPKSVRERIIVLAISPGKIIPRELCYESYNYASKKDFVPKLDVIGRIRYGNELILLDPDPKAPEHDHGLDSPTFQRIIKENLQNYIMDYGGSR